MRKRAWMSAVCLSAAVAVAGAGVSPPVASAAAGVRDASVDGDRVWVRYLALSDPRSVVRIAAWQALLSSTPDQAVAEFLESGFDYAVRLSGRQQVLNADFAQRVLDTYPASFSPAVHEAARRAVASRDPDALARFASGGFAAARRQDSAARAAAGEQAAAVAAADREAVCELAHGALGAQVRVSAAYAVRTGATDTDVADFFAAEWGFAARLDLDAHRRTGADREARWRAGLSGLLAAASAAEKAARDAAGSATAQQAAVEAWQRVADGTGDARAYWEQARQVAAAEAAQWGETAARAAAEGGNWDAIARSAGGTQDAWTAEADTASSRKAYWDDVLARARAGQDRVRAIAPAGS